MEIRLITPADNRCDISKVYEDVGFKTVDENAEEYIMVCEL